ncbi:unnamed protein product [Cercospora beticola]|nr:unnamed protein product [Cercospora beticola]
MFSGLKHLLLLAALLGGIEAQCTGRPWACSSDGLYIIQCNGLNGEISGPCTAPDKCIMCGNDPICLGSTADCPAPPQIPPGGHRQ